MKPSRRPKTEKASPVERQAECADERDHRRVVKITERGVLDVLEVIRLIKRRAHVRSPDQPQHRRDGDQCPERMAGFDARSLTLVIRLPGALLRVSIALSLTPRHLSGSKCTLRDRCRMSRHLPFRRLGCVYSRRAAAPRDRADIAGPLTGTMRLSDSQRTVGRCSQDPSDNRPVGYGFLNRFRAAQGKRRATSASDESCAICGSSRVYFSGQLLRPGAAGEAAGAAADRPPRRST